MSQPNLNEDLNIVANSNIEITLLDGDLNIIQALDDEPNDVGGLTSAELKAKFDEAGNTIKTYINGTLIPEILTEEATEAARAAAEAQREVNENQRIENENARIAAEQARVDETNGVVAQANNAAQSWAVGGTGTREGEDTNNAKYWSEQAAAAAGGGVTSFKGRTGSVIPASGDYTAEMVGAYSKGETDTLLQNKADTTKKASITLTPHWTGDASPYTQAITISGTTANSKVDLQPDATTITQMADDGTAALYIANDNGTLTAYAVGEKPTVELTIQATITEVSA